MNVVQPIRALETIERMKNELLKNGTRDYLLFVFGINTGLRIGDILALQVKDVRNQTHLVLREEKTGKLKRHFLNEQLKQDIDNYIQGMDDEEYLFQSRKGENQPISRVQAYRILKGAADKVGIENIGTHTLRKTYGYHQYKRNRDIVKLQHLFNHSSPSETLRYIGIQQDDLDDMNRDFYL